MNTLVGSTAISLSIHAFFLLLVLAPGTSLQKIRKTEQQSSTIAGRVKLQAKTMEVLFVEGTGHVNPSRKSKRTIKKAKPVTDEGCGAFYEGVGLSSHFNDSGAEIITEVYPGYPASKAGIEVGDVILQSSSALPGPKGTLVHLVIHRNGITQDVAILRDKICLY